MKKVIESDCAPRPVGPYSQGIEASGFIFVSGQLPVDPKTGSMPDTPGDQAKQSLENIKAILEKQGASMADVVKTTVFLADIGDFAAVNEVYASYFPAPEPARSCFAVAALPKAAKVEIEVIAVKS